MLSKSLSFVLLVAALLLASCCPVCMTGTPDQAVFEKAVLSQALRDSLKNNTLTLGMPYSAVRMVFPGCIPDKSIQVAASGHRQELLETEGMYSTFQDANIQTFVNKFKTSQGDLYIWYGNVDFYKAGISAGDSVVLYSASNIIPAHVTSLLTSQKFRTELTLTKGMAIPYAEIYAHDGAASVSYWYDLSVSGTDTIKQKTQSTPNYPILHMELGKTVITSFHWK